MKLRRTRVTQPYPPFEGYQKARPNEEHKGNNEDGNIGNGDGSTGRRRLHMRIWGIQPFQ